MDGQAEQKAYQNDPGILGSKVAEEKRAISKMTSDIHANIDQLMGAVGTLRKRLNPVSLNVETQPGTDLALPPRDGSSPHFHSLADARDAVSSLTSTIRSMTHELEV